MNTLTKIVCRSVGTAGMGLALYEAAKVGGQFARNGAQNEQAKYLEKAYYTGRTIDSVNYTSNNVRQKVFDLRTRNPLPAFWGKIKGCAEGVSYALGDNLFTIACSGLALVSKGVLAKLGAAGIVLGVSYDIARNGYGLGKQNPMD